MSSCSSFIQSMTEIMTAWASRRPSTKSPKYSYSSTRTEFCRRFARSTTVDICERWNGFKSRIPASTKGRIYPAFLIVRENMIDDCVVWDNDHCCGGYLKPLAGKRKTNSNQLFITIAFIYVPLKLFRAPHSPSPFQHLVFAYAGLWSTTPTSVNTLHSFTTSLIF